MTMTRSITVIDDPRLPAPGLAARAGLDGHPRGRARGRRNGINTVTTKLLAFALGASTAGFAGVFSAAKLTLVSPDLFGFNVSFTVLAMVVLGGMGNIWGVALGAFILFMIQSVLLKQLNLFFDNVRCRSSATSTSSQYQFLLYGIALVAMMLLRPEGLFPSRRRKRELHTEEDATSASGRSDGRRRPNEREPRCRRRVERRRGRPDGGERPPTSESCSAPTG